MPQPPASCCFPVGTAALSKPFVRMAIAAHRSIAVIVELVCYGPQTISIGCSEPSMTMVGAFS
ncbi:hypothetical protein GGE35_005526 [Rhizobium cellulosilyticum]|uniref:Uncharacterized protein n=1 Tax=Aliirhizobium cellulosilyticum TaxID=393664 RepID=A0A7W6V488_9HYPH|nr:hypothetical protein [Rhizobium cellulosilyticum]MBB4414953.1 hypothetical protein [Rhizobium cellulosilyticum]MBB4449668.1 hypothetical protein [Rhizobium cellulosilyticum]